LRYRAVLRPWLWFLTRTSHCRIFQDMSVPDIIKQVLELNGFHDFIIKTSRVYTPAATACNTGKVISILSAA